MLMASHTQVTPWTIVKSDDKKKARINCIRHILNSINYAKRSKDDIFNVDKKILIGGALELENMQREKLA